MNDSHSAPDEHERSAAREVLPGTLVLRLHLSDAQPGDHQPNEDEGLRDGGPCRGIDQN